MLTEANVPALHYIVRGWLLPAFQYFKILIKFVL